jgi:cell division initiation protein
MISMPTPFEIRKKDFQKVMRGYDQTEVRAFLSEVAIALEQLQAKCEEAARKTATLETQMKEYQSIEKILHETLAQAKETGERSVEKARSEAASIVRDAEAKASDILNASRGELTALKEQIIVLRAKRDSISARLRSLLSSELDLVKTFETDEVAAGSTPGESATGPRTWNPEIEEIVKNIDTPETL